MKVLRFMVLTYAWWLCVTSASGQHHRESHYKRCEKGKGIFKGNVITTMTSVRLRCFQECTSDDRCKSVNVCPSTTSETLSTCELLDGYADWFCRDLDPAPNPQCFHAQKETYCMNGGHERDNGTCKCDLCFKGTYCTERVRDCQEAVELIAADGGYNKGTTCYVQPTSSPRPFQVWCPFQDKSTTSVLYRVQASSGWSQLDWKTFKWAQFKEGMGNYETYYNFFTGLEYLRHFLGQAEYRLNVYNFYFKQPNEPVIQPSYKNVTLQDEKHNYALSYSLYTNNFPNELLDLQSFKGPDLAHPFCTEERDCNNCARDKGPGWYYVEGDGNCVGHSPFAPIAQWPYGNGTVLTIDFTDYSLERVGDFY